MARELIQKYLNNPCDQTIVIQHAKVAQKSYGSEKRFFCPPPCIYLSGVGWGDIHPTGLTNESNQQQSIDLCAYMGINNSSQEMVELHLEKKNFSSAKTLFISDSDKRKHFILRVVLCYADNSGFGIFHSKPIKVISKPSKKKQSIKNPELCIASGSKIALFNRLRSQTVSTRYLHVEDSCFHASSLQWGSFYIHMLENDVKESDEFDMAEGYIHYGATVKLVCTVTNLALPRLIIRKVDKQTILLNAEEPVSQLHKCAFQVKDSLRNYLCLMQDKIVIFQASQSGKDESRHTLNDGVAWSIISTESVSYTFSHAYVTHRSPVTPVPVVHHIVKNGSGPTAMIELAGENFSSVLKVWLGDIETETFYRCEELLVCTIPEFDRYTTDWPFQQLPVLLVRNDGVIYRTDHTFSYTQEPVFQITSPPTNFNQII